MCAALFFQQRDLPAGSCWMLTRLAKRGTLGTGSDDGRAYVDRLVAEGPDPALQGVATRPRRGRNRVAVARAPG